MHKSNTMPSKEGSEVGGSILPLGPPFILFFSSFVGACTSSPSFLKILFILKLERRTSFHHDSESAVMTDVDHSLQQDSTEFKGNGE